MKLTHYLFGVCLFATAIRAQQANLSPSKADFGNVAIASTASQQVDFSNPTKKTVNIFTVTIDGDFAIPSFPCNLAMGELSGCGFQVTFTPAALGPRTGTLTITSDSPDSPHKVKLSGTGVPVQMISISVAPSTPTIPKGLTQQFFATGNFNNGTAQEITGSVVWTSSTPGVASIAAGGLATTVAQGNTTIKATSGALSGSTVAAVGPPVLQSIRITPQMTAIPKGLKQQFVATGTLTDGTTQDVTNSVQWISTAIGVATINPAGLATGVAVGLAGIRCSLGTVDSGIYPSLLTVSAPVLISATITPANPSIPLNFSLQLRATGTYSDGSTGDVTNLAFWSPMGPVVSSQRPGIVTVHAFVGGGLGGGGETTLEFGGVYGAVSAMSTNRVLHTATRLSSGKVLLAGGGTSFGCCTELVSAELFDPGSNGFTPTGAMSSVRQQHTATLLNDGRVLIAGNDFVDATAELYDPAAGTFSPTGSMATGRSGHTATLLVNGQVLIAGGSGSTAELYNPATGTFAATGRMTTPRQFHTATLLNSGQVLITGGTAGAGALASAEIYDPVSGIFSSAGAMTVARSQHRATLLNGGKVLLTGGFSSLARTATAELYDPATGLFSTTGSMSVARDTHTATLTTGGQVLVMSGAGDGNVVLSSSEKYDPVSGAFAPTGSIDLVHFNNTRVGHTATLLLGGQILAAGGVPAPNPAPAGLYQPSIVVPPGLTGITVSPSGVTIPVGVAQQFVATGSFNNGPNQILNSVFWSLFVNPTGAINGDGVATGLSAGQAAVSASAGPLFGFPTPGGNAIVNVQ